MNPNIPSPIELRRWSPDEERRAVIFRDQEHKTWHEIGIILDRSRNAVEHCYTVIKQRQHSSVVEWTRDIDNTIIEGRRLGLSLKQISINLSTVSDNKKLTSKALGDRWNQLQRDKLVPEEVLAVWRRKTEVVFTPEQDEKILKLCMQGLKDEQLARMVEFKGKSHAAIRERRLKLIDGHSPVYVKLLGSEGVKVEESDAFKKALGKPKYGWME